jgi:hypothetical protein
MAILFAQLVRRTNNNEAGALVIFFLKMCAASAFAALLTWKLVGWLEPRFGWHTAPGAFGILVIASFTGFALTGGGAKLLRVRECDTYAARLLARSPRANG